MTLHKKWALAIALIATCLTTPSQAHDSQALAKDTCVLIDTDYDIDDMMAIPLVIGNRRVAGIVMSEGYTLPREGAAALERLIRQPQQRKIPIIVGGQQDDTGRKDLQAWPWLPFYRAMMNQSNGLLPQAPVPAPISNDYRQEVVDATAACSEVSVLIIGTYTSFVQYSPRLRHQIKQVVVMGQPIGDDSRTPGRESFNCSYDMPACQTAMEQLKGVSTAFIDIPRDTTPLYEPSEAMVTALVEDGLPGALKRALINSFDCSGKFTQYGRNMPIQPHGPYSACTSKSTWVPHWVHQGPGGEMLLWDQAAALYLLHPEIFTPKGAHLEPALVDDSAQATIQRMRKYWTDDTNKATDYR